MARGDDLLSIVLLIIGFIANLCVAKAEFTAMYVFGDSLSDPGNNIYFNHSLAKANFWAYGIDFDRGANGRFCNGKILVDFLGEFLGFPLLPSYADTIAKGVDILSGVNYASAGAGILSSTGYTLGRVIPLSEQIDNFRSTTTQLKIQIKSDEELSKYLSRALVVVVIGANDYLNNYLLPLLYKSSLIYSPTQFANLLINHYTDCILELRSLGIRKFFLAEASPVGCAPITVRSNGECESSSNDKVQMFNLKLKYLVNQLNRDYPGSAFTVGASFRMFFDLRNNADAYGFKVKDRACWLSSGKSGGSGHVSPINAVTPCLDRDEYIFWDYAHPSEAANRILAHFIYNTTSYTSPFTIQQMAAM